MNSGDYVQIANDKGEKWFMRILNGKVLRKNTDDPVLASALWCETNNVARLSSQFTNADHVKYEVSLMQGLCLNSEKKAALLRDCAQLKIK